MGHHHIYCLPLSHSRPQKADLIGIYGPYGLAGSLGPRRLIFIYIYGPHGQAGSLDLWL